MHRHLAKHSTFLSLWLVAASVSMPVATAQARVHIPAKPSVEINLDVLQHLSDVLPEGAAPVDDIEEQEVGAYRPRREHAARKVPEENPYTPPVSKAKPRKTTRSSTTGEPPFYLGKSPAARIESRPLPRITEKKKAPKAAPVKITKKKTPPKPKAETPPPPPPPAPKPKELAAAQTPAQLPVVQTPPALPEVAPVVAPAVVPVPPPAVVPVMPKTTPPPAPEVLVKREVPNNPMALPLPNLPDVGEDNVAELTALPPQIAQRVEDAFAVPEQKNKGLSETRRVINPVEMREAERKAQAEAKAAAEAAAPPPLALPVPGGDAVPALPDALPPALPSVDSLTQDPEPSLELAVVDDQIFSTDPMDAVEGLEAPSEADIKANQQKLAPPPPPAETGLGSIGDAKLSVGFQPNMQDLMPAEKDRLSELAKQINDREGTVRIMAYAGGSPDQASMARRVSLSRALSVRAFLIDKGVDQLRIEVKAKGNKDAGENPDRADIFIQ